MDQENLFIVLHYPNVNWNYTEAHESLSGFDFEDNQPYNTIWFKELEKHDNLISSIKYLTIVILPGKIDQKCKILDDSFSSNKFLEKLTYVWVSNIGSKLERLTPYLNISKYDEVPRFLNKSFHSLRLEAFPYEGYIPTEHKVKAIRLSKDTKTIELCNINCFVLYFDIPLQQESSCLSSIIITITEITPLGMIAFYGDGMQQVKNRIEEGKFIMTWKVIEIQKTIQVQEPEHAYYTEEKIISSEESVNLTKSDINFRQIDGTEIEAMFLDPSKIFPNYKTIDYLQWGSNLQRDPTKMTTNSFDSKFGCCANVCSDR